MKSKVWTKPKLIVLFKGRSEEAVLQVCKTSGRTGRSGGNVPVAIFSSATFDATTVEPITVTLASAPVKLKGKGTPMSSSEDVNDDGLMDLVVHVDTEALQLSETDEEAVLEGQTSNGTPIRGVDTVRVVP